MKKILLIACLLGVAAVRAQSYHDLINDGVDKYKEKNYSDAEKNFKKSLSVDSSKFAGSFDLGAAQYKQGNFKDAAASFEKALERAKTKEEIASANHNLGNALLKANDYEKSIDAYKNALRQNPNDADTKYNLSVALDKQKKDQNKNKNKQNKDNKDNKDKNKQDQNKDKNKDDKKKDDKKDNKDQQNKDQQNKDQQNKQNKPQPKMSKQQAEQFLNAIKDNEKDIQKKLRKRAAVRVKTEKDW